jgi:hypothetical protein
MERPYQAGWRALATAALLLLVVAAHSAAAGEDQPAVVQRNRECPKGCIDRGNCNAERGVCECPWGYDGALPERLGLLQDNAW